VTEDTGKEASKENGADSGDTGAGKTKSKAPKRDTFLQKIEHNWLEIFAAALLSLATIMSAFSAYQASLWDGKENKSYSQATTYASRQANSRTRATSRYLSTSVC
jgi:hypothetical protein